MTTNYFSQALNFINDHEYKTTPQENLSKLIRKKFPHWPLPLIGLVCEQKELRLKASQKFKNASQMIFTRKGLEQSTSETISNFTASLFSKKSEALEVCSGIGGNSIGLKNNFENLTTVEPDPILNEVHKHNLHLYYPDNQIKRIHSELKCDHLKSYPCIFIDPDRRATGSRSNLLKDHSPDIKMILENCKENQEVIFKFSPMLNSSETVADFKYLYLADEMDLKQNLWYSQSLESIKINFVIHFANEVFSNQNYPVNTKLINKNECIFEMNSAIIKAGESFKVAQHFELEPLLNSQKHYIGAAKSIYPFATTWEVIAKETYHPKKITEFLKAQPFERFDFKPNGIDEKETKNLISKWGKGQGKAGTVFIFKNKDFKQIYLTNKISLNE